MMAHSKTGKTAKDIFAATDTPAPPAGPGRPPSHEEAWTKVTVVLFTRHIMSLDRLALDIRQNTRAVVKRAEIIRALIDAVAASDLDLTNATSEAAIRDLLVAKLRR
jgi:hypothetical protein